MGNVFLTPTNASIKFFMQRLTKEQGGSSAGSFINMLLTQACNTRRQIVDRP